MANPRDIEQLEKSKESFAAWRATNQHHLDATDHNFNGRDFSGWDLSNVDFSRATLSGTNLRGARFQRGNLGGANLAGADLTDADFTGAQLGNVRFENATLQKTVFIGAEFARDAGHEPAKLVECDFSKATLNSGEWSRCEFTRCRFDNSACTGARFNNTRLEGSTFCNANLTNTSFVGASCQGVEFAGALLYGTDLSVADLEAANFHEAVLRRTNFKGARNAHLACNLERTFIPHAPEEHPLRFDEVERCPLERWCDWEMIRSAGRMQLFGASYFLMVYLVTMFYLVGQYNDKLNAIRAWAETKGADGNIATKQVTERLLNFEPFPISKTSVLLLVSTMILVAASIIYALGCPAVVKSFSSADWRYAHGRSLVHYWPLSWRQRYIRLLCASLYVAGATILLPITLLKLGVAIQYAWEFGSWSL